MTAFTLKVLNNYLSYPTSLPCPLEWTGEVTHLAATLNCKTTMSNIDRAKNKTDYRNQEQTLKFFINRTTMILSDDLRRLPETWQLSTEATESLHSGGGEQRSAK